MDGVRMAQSLTDGGAGEDKATRPRRKKSAEQTQRDILVAAGRRFARAGYAAVTLKDIADDVGVTAPLVVRYFGSKHNLFREVAKIEGGPDIDAADLAGPLETLGPRLARQLVAYWLDPDISFPAIALVRSLDVEEAKTLFVEEVNRRLIDPLVATLPGPGAWLRARLVAAQAVGFGLFAFGTLLEPDTRLPAASDIEVEDIVTLFGAALQACITPAGSPSPPPSPGAR
ncbi:TetR/AcrR family transcriptional regulator [Pseudonocardia asaccharolytica]|uniref:TetR family transcriptional regulator n=1 Tax=Pseudonocardia asaccharolytica DSM 44247 = NBRC 16224 TaxID=1123024 RepID=A0A511D5D2_9PSEU|nr:TetR/AcrR family transcriptional regulator [Pseudonocardia asaccharolytica]GEL18138.1 TetR family transcriptional regulator [Pseudonocardia asaccharolytica DSM 44247 = NBRC 16224]